jgi:methyl-accepting chemotaxis protein
LAAFATNLRLTIAAVVFAAPKRNTILTQPAQQPDTPATKRITFRLAAIAAIATIALLVVTLSAFWAGAALMANTRETADIAAALLNHTSLKQSHDGLRTDVFGALANDEIGLSPDMVRSDYRKHAEALRSALSAFESMELPDSMRASIAGIEEPVSAYIKTATDVIETSFVDRSAAVAMLPAFSVKYRALQQTLDNIVGTFEAQSLLLEAQTRSFVTWMKAVFIPAALVLLGAIAWLTYYVWKSLIKPVREIRVALADLAEGKLDIEELAVDRRDEIGAMARAVQVFKENTIARIELERSSVEQREQAESLRESAETERRNRYLTEAAVAKEQDAFLKRLAVGLSHLAKGELQYELPEATSESFARITADFNETAAQLRGIMGQIGASTLSVQDATAEIVTGVRDLSSRTEQQASSLEQTAASMEELSATVRQNAEHAQEANAVAAAARQLAVDSGGIAGRAVAAMGKIEQSTRQVSEITGLIQEIAFQTNILALNAAVEAARAGDAGRGFAVVANEVRSLAQRAAKASTDIKKLVEDTGSDVAEGAAMVNQAGQSLTQIVNAVRKVADLVSEIAAASREQASGIDQVSRAVTNMDEMTQHNAALVEETNAALTSTQVQLEQLRKAVMFFRTEVSSQNDARQTPLKEGGSPAALNPDAETSLHDKLRQLAAKMASAQSTGKPARPEPRTLLQQNAIWKEF